MGSVSQDLFLSPLSLSLSLHPTVTMFFLRRLPLLLLTIFLGLFCLPQTNTCTAQAPPDCDGFTPDQSKCHKKLGDNGHTDETCLKNNAKTCNVKCTKNSKGKWEAKKDCVHEG